MTPDLRRMRWSVSGACGSGRRCSSSGASCSPSRQPICRRRRLRCTTACSGRRPRSWRSASRGYGAALARRDENPEDRSSGRRSRLTARALRQARNHEAAPTRRPAPLRRWCELLDLDLGALLLEGCLDLLGLVLGDALLDGLRRRVDEVLRLLEAQAGELANDLDHRDLVGADLGEDGRELGLLLLDGGRGGSTATRGRRRGDGDGGRGGDAEAVLELLLELRELEHGHLLEGLEELVGGQGGHRGGFSVSVGIG